MSADEPGTRPRGTGFVRFRLDLGYDGTDFSGWAAQPGLRTVEGTLAAALTTILRAEEPVRLTVAGRTDAGVHARGQVAHFDPDPTAWAALPGRSTRTTAEAALSRLRGILPADIGMRAVAVAADGFDARFAALQRRYLYRLADRPELVDPLRRRETVVTKRALDVESMHAAAQELLGLNDFGAFCKRRAGATTVRRPGWAAQPEKSVPSYPKSSRIRRGAVGRSPCSWSMRQA
jgi:tRNA pseudouridine38-40 synthase